MGPWQLQALKTAGLCAMFTLPEMGSLAQAQQAPKPPVSVEAPKATSPVKPKPTAEELERWRQTIVRPQRPEKGCFVVEYPATAWSKTPCGKPPKVAFLPSNVTPIGQGNDDVAESQYGPFKSAEGSFDAVIGVHSACSTTCPNGVCPTTYTCTSGNTPNNYSLQLNTNQFPTTIGECKGNPGWGCQGWVQFVFANRGCTQDWLADVFVHNPACVFIEYWLFNYGNGCPPGPWKIQHPPAWSGHTIACGINSQNAAILVPFLVDDLGFMKLYGAVAGVDGPDDSVTLWYAGKGYKVSGDNLLPDLGRNWTQAEFNVFGIGNGDQVVFNPGSTLVVRVVVNSGTLHAPHCTTVGSGVSAESNNLGLIGLQALPTNAPNTGPAAVHTPLPQSIPFSPPNSTQEGNAFGGPWSGGQGPALVFGESNAYPSGSLAYTSICQNVVTVGGTN